jgi:hypothetical protein
MGESPKRSWCRRRIVIVSTVAAASILPVAFVLVAGGARVRDATRQSVAAPSELGSTAARSAKEVTGSSSVGYSAQSGGADATSSAPGQDVSAALPPLDPTRFLVQTGDMTLYVAKGEVAMTAGKVTALVDGLGGYVLQSNLMSGIEGQKPTATISVRVPAQNYQEAIRRVSSLGEVKMLSTGTEDVTGQYVDLKARLAHYRAVERRLLTFLANAQSIEQALAIQQRIDNTQLTVEELTAQVKAMREQVTYGTLTIGITEKPAKAVVVPKERDTFIAAFVNSATLLAKGARAAFVALGAAIPFIVLIAVLGWLGWMVARRLGRLTPRRDSQSVELHS